MSQSRDNENDQNKNLNRSHGDMSRMINQGRSFSGLERNCSFLNTGNSSDADGRFATVSAVTGIDFPDDGRALVPIDWDHDGDLDLWISSRNGPRIRFFQNTATTDNTYITLNLVGNGTTTNRDGVGARVELLSASPTGRSVQTLRAGDGFLSQESKWIHFGLGPTSSAVDAMVHWPGGASELYKNLHPNTRYTLVQGTGEIRSWPVRDTPSLKPSEPLLPGASQRVRIPLLTPLPMPKILFSDYQGAPRQYSTGFGKSVLVLLWASWCPTCSEELQNITREQHIYTDNGVDVLALSVDKLGDERSNITLAQRILKDLGFPFTSGLVTKKLIRELQEIHNLVVPLDHQLPVPASFLIGPDGRISTIYKGVAQLNDILKDSLKGKLSPAESLANGSPFSGRTIESPTIERVYLENKARMLFFRGTQLIERQQFDDAIHHFLDVLDIKPQSYKTHYNLGLAYNSIGNSSSALYHLGKALAIHPELHHTYQLMGSIHQNRGHPQQAKKYYLQYLNRFGADTQVLTALGALAIQEGKSTEAIQRFREALAIAPDLNGPKYNLGTVLLAHGDDEEAENLFLSILQNNPSYPDACYNLGHIYEKRGEIDMAKSMYTEEIANTPKSAKSLTALGLIIEQAGHISQAKQYYLQAIAVEPEFHDAHNQLARLNNLN